MPAWTVLLKPLTLAALSIGSVSVVVKMQEQKIDRFVMGIVREVGRYKAKKRRLHNAKSDMALTSLTKMLLHQDDPMQDLGITTNAEDEDESHLETYTADELLEFGDGQDGRPILLALFGRVYDVSAGAKFYGPEDDGARYGHFAGRDVSYALCTGCKTLDCVEKGGDVDDLDESDLNEGKRWLSFFHLHDKYPLVGKMEADYLEELLSMIGDDVEDGSNSNMSSSSSATGKEEDKEEPMAPPIIRQSA